MQAALGSMQSSGGGGEGAEELQECPLAPEQRKVDSALDLPAGPNEEGSSWPDVNPWWASYLQLPTTGYVCSQGS